MGYIREGLLSEGFLRLSFGGLIFGTASLFFFVGGGGGGEGALTVCPNNFMNKLVLISARA